MLHALYLKLDSNGQIDKVCMYDSVSKKMKGGTHADCMSYMRDGGVIANLEIVGNKLRYIEVNYITSYRSIKTGNNPDRIGYDSIAFKDMCKTGVGLYDKFEWLIGINIIDDMLKVVNFKGKERIVSVKQVDTGYMVNCEKYRNRDTGQIELKVPTSNIELFGAESSDRVSQINSNLSAMGTGYRLSHTNDSVIFNEGEIITSLVVPTGVKRIQASEGELRRTKLIQLPNTITNFKVRQFSDCLSLEKFIMENGTKVKSLPREFLSRCALLKELVIPEGIETMTSMCLISLIGLQRIKLPDTIRTLKDYFIYDVTGIELIVPIGCTYVDIKAFDAMHDCNIYIPKHLFGCLAGHGHKLSGLRNIVTYY